MVNIFISYSDRNKGMQTAASQQRIYGNSISYLLLFNKLVKHFCSGVERFHSFFSVLFQPFLICSEKLQITLIERKPVIDRVHQTTHTRPSPLLVIQSRRLYVLEDCMLLVFFNTFVTEEQITSNTEASTELCRVDVAVDSLLRSYVFVIFTKLYLLKWS